MATTPNNQDGPKREIGALWARSGAKGSYYTGKIRLSDLKGKDEVKVIVWTNSDKKTENSPDLRILLELNEYEALAGLPSTRKASATPANVDPPKAAVKKTFTPRKPVVEEEELM